MTLVWPGSLRPKPGQNGWTIEQPVLPLRQPVQLPGISVVTAGLLAEERQAMTMFSDLPGRNDGRTALPYDWTAYCSVRLDFLSETQTWKHAVVPIHTSQQCNLSLAESSLYWWLRQKKNWASTDFSCNYEQDCFACNFRIWWPRWWTALSRHSSSYVYIGVCENAWLYIRHICHFFEGNSQGKILGRSGGIWYCHIISSVGCFLILIR